MNYYTSEDAGAPQIPPGSVGGALVAVLKAVLVTGYGAKAAAGWSNPFNSGSTVACFKQGVGANNRVYRVWDAQTSDNVYGYRQINIRGYEAMTAISTGTGPFPTTAQCSGNGLVMAYKVNTTYDPGSGNVNIPWRIWADAHTVIIATTPTGNPVDASNFITFGAFESNKASDPYSEMVTGFNGEYLTGYQGSYNDYTTMFVTRTGAGTGGSVPACVMAVQAPQVSSMMGTSTYQYPDEATGSILLSKATILTAVGGDPTLSKMRGVLKWFWDTPHNVLLNFPPETTFSGNGLNAGKTFGVVGGYNGAGCGIIETSNTWS